MKPVRIEERHLLLGGGCALIVLVAALVYGVLPVWKAQQQLIDERDRLDRLTRGQDLSLLTRQANTRLTNARAILDELLASGRIAHLESHVMSELEARAQASRLRLDGVKPVYAEGVPGFEETRFEVKIRGEYFNVYDWLVDLEASIPYLVIRKLHIFNSDGPSENPLLNVHLTVSTYRRPPA